MSKIAYAVVSKEGKYLYFNSEWGAVLLGKSSNYGNYLLDKCPLVLEKGEVRIENLTIRGRIFEVLFVPVDEKVILIVKEKDLSRSYIFSIYKGVSNADFIWVDVLDRDGYVVLWNKGAESISGYKAEEVVGRRDVWEKLYPDRKYRDKIFGRALDVIEKGDVVKGFETEILSKDRKVRTIKWYSTRFEDDNGTVLGSIAVGTDVTEEKLLRKRLKEEKEKFETYLDLANIMFVVIGSDMNVRFVNRKAEKILGYKRDEILGRNWFDNFLTDDEKYKVKEVFRKIIEGKSEEINYYENHIVTRNGEKRLIGWYSTFLRDENGRIVATLSAGEDITKQRKESEDLRKLTFHDALTGLFNRHYFEKKFKEINTPENYPVSVVVVDADNLKKINDTMGHKSGDEFLITIATSLKQTARRGDIVARIGGDEFAVILPKTDKHGAAAFCNRLRRMCLLRRKIPCSVSIGYATREEYGPSLDDLLKEADRRMYEDKESRRASRNDGNVLLSEVLVSIGKREEIDIEGDAIVIKRGDIPLERWNQLKMYLKKFFEEKEVGV